MNFDLTDEQKLLVDTVASFVKRQSPVTRLRALREDPRGWSPEVWQQMGEYGWLGVLFPGSLGGSGGCGPLSPESLGGSGGSFVDVPLIVEQLGAGLVPEPILPSLIAAAPILRLGTEEQQQAVLVPMIEGRTSLALAYAEATSRF